MAMKSRLGLLAPLTLLSALIFSISLPAAAEIAIIVNPQNPATRMLGSQAAQFFLGGSTMFAPVEQPESAPIRSEFYKKVLEKEPAQVKAIWSKLLFTGKVKAPQEGKSSAEVKKLVSQSTNAIGYIEKSEVDDSVKVVAIIP
jgi:ABC-type phosphate transport system substrate-binding protein